MQVQAALSEDFAERSAFRIGEVSRVIAVDRAGNEAAAEGGAAESRAFLAAEGGDAEREFPALFAEPFQAGHAGSDTGHAVIAAAAHDAVQMRADENGTLPFPGCRSRGIVFQIAVADSIGVGNEAVCFAPVAEDLMHAVFRGTVAEAGHAAAVQRAGLLKESHEGFDVFKFFRGQFHVTPIRSIRIRGCRSRARLPLRGYVRRGVNARVPGNGPGRGRQRRK